MTCFCSAKAAPLGSMSLTLPAGLLPPISMNLMAALSASLGLPPLSLTASLNLGAPAPVIANLSAMASFSAALRAMGMAGLQVKLPIPALQAQLAASITSFNAGSGMLMPQLGPLLSLNINLAGLGQLAGLMLALKAALGIDLRAPGAIAALQARLQMPVLPAVALNAQVSAVASLLAALGLKADASGALAAGAMARATAKLGLGLPTLGNLNLLALLASLLPMLDAIKLALGVDLRAPNSTAALRASLSALPLSALAQLSATIALPPLPSVAAALAVKANAAAALNLSAVAKINLAFAAPLTMLLSVMAKGQLGLPPGECGMPCPLALLKGAPPVASFSAS